MSDNTVLNLGSGGDTIASDDIAGVKYQRVKVTGGADGTATDIGVGGGTEATALRVTLASDSTGVVSVDDNGSSLTVDNAALSVVGGGAEATALRVTIASDSTGVVSVDDNGGSITVDNGGTFAVQVSSAIPAGTNNIGDVDVLSVIPGTGATSLGKAEDAAHTTGDTGVMALTVRANTAAATSGTDGDYQPLITDTNGRLHVIEPSAAASLTALQLIDDVIFTDDAAFTVATSKGAVMMGVATTDAVNSGDAGAVRMTTSRDLCVVMKDASGNDINPQVDDAAFTAGTSLVSVIAAVATSDSVDANDAGAVGMTTDRAMFVNPRPATSGGLTIFRSIDLDESEEEIKASAGQVYSIAAFNTNASARYLKLYNATAANVTVGTTTPVLTYYLPGTGGFVLDIPYGLAFGTAITAAATTGVADNDTGAPSANDVIVNIGYK